MTQDLQKEVELSAEEYANILNELDYIDKLCMTEKTDEFHHTLHVDIPTTVEWIKCLLRAAETPPTPAKESCEHEWDIWGRGMGVDHAMCLKCKALRQEPTLPNPPEDEL